MTLSREEMKQIRDAYFELQMEACSREDCDCLSFCERTLADDPTIALLDRELAEPEVCEPDPNEKRCTSVEAGLRCGDYIGHEGKHTAMIPSGAPWFSLQCSQESDAKPE